MWWTEGKNRNHYSKKVEDFVLKHLHDFEYIETWTIKVNSLYATLAHKAFLTNRAKEDFKEESSYSDKELFDILFDCYLWTHAEFGGFD